MKKNISFKQIQDLLSSKYEIKTFEIQTTQSGLINYSFFISTKKENYVLRIYSHKTKKEIEFEIKIMNLARKNGLPVPKIFKNKFGNYLTKQIYKKVEYYCILMKFIDGNELKRNDIYMLKPTGSLHAKMHIFFRKKVQKRENMKQILKKWDRWSKEEIKKMEVILRKFGLQKPYFEKFYETKKDLSIYLKDLRKIPNAECHNDFFGGNILIKNKKVVGIVDFDNVEVAPLVFEIANTLKSWLFLSKPEKYKIIIKNYIKGYQKYRKLSKIELKILPEMIAMRNFAVTNSIFCRGLVKNKKRIEQAIKFHDNWKKFLKEEEISELF